METREEITNKQMAVPGKLEAELNTTTVFS